LEDRFAATVISANAIDTLSHLYEQDNHTLNVQESRINNPFVIIYF